MSELIAITDSRAAIRWKLLTSASALVLAGYFSSASLAHADDADRPAVWLEVDGQFALLSADEEPFLPPLVLASQFDNASKIARKKPPSVWSEGAKISFEPEPDWILSLGIRYGKSSRQKSGYQQTEHYASSGPYSNTRFHTAFQGGRVSSSEKHLILDFRAGKDFGIGMFGQQGSSLVSVGVRYAQFDSRSNTSVHSITAKVPTSYYIFHASFEAKREFRGVGPSLSWDASANIAGNQSDGSLTLDWGVNGAVLFGRQKVKGHHEKTAIYQPSSAYYHASLRTTRYRTAASPSRDKNVTVPNLGGYAALSLRYTNLKVTFGYRADYFFDAIDGGIDVANREDRGFNGPYASISVGLGG